ncbi:MAG TPA: carbon monoxide dehydrogenase accessory protein CooC [Syntrophorhabdaceae bacterium]|nr:carbon monoxide dehydrogenase accessory protein CooC [Syntrophorhabdaceae bacterium]HPU30512.1 carbon monoxide dehydrogenase accessory protein CooC [Syntrophorhabdaceae bacterium]
MKVAISGKGGVGKTTLAGIMARILDERGNKVLAIDADPDANLADAIGFSEDELKLVKPIAEMEEFIRERTGSKKGQYGTFFKLNPKVDDIPDRFSVVKGNIKLVILGNIAKGGGGCFCPENVLLKNLISHVLIERDEFVIVDMEAGLEHLGRGTTEFVDSLIVVVEPGKRSIQTAKDIKRLAGDLGIKNVYVVGNKIKGDEDVFLLKEELDGFSYLGSIGYNENLLKADRLGVSPYDMDNKIKEEVIKILDNLRALHV